MEYHFSSRLTATLNLCLIYFKIIWALAILLEHMHKKFEINRTNIKGGCQLGSKVVPQDSKSDLPLVGAKFIEVFVYTISHHIMKNVGSIQWYLLPTYIIVWIYILAENILQIYIDTARFIHAWLECRAMFEKGIYSVIDTWLLYGLHGTNRYS